MNSSYMKPEVYQKNKNKNKKNKKWFIFFLAVSFYPPVTLAKKLEPQSADINLYSMLWLYFSN